jgi:hypothetical protein
MWCFRLPIAGRCAPAEDEENGEGRVLKTFSTVSFVPQSGPLTSAAILCGVKPGGCPHTEYRGKGPVSLGFWLVLPILSV